MNWAGKDTPCRRAYATGSTRTPAKETPRAEGAASGQNRLKAPPVWAQSSDHQIRGAWRPARRPDRPYRSRSAQSPSPAGLAPAWINVPDRFFDRVPRWPPRCAWTRCTPPLAPRSRSRRTTVDGAVGLAHKTDDAGGQTLEFVRLDAARLDRKPNPPGNRRADAMKQAHEVVNVLRAEFHRGGAVILAVDTEVFTLDIDPSRTELRRELREIEIVMGRMARVARRIGIAGQDGAPLIVGSTAVK